MDLGVDFELPVDCLIIQNRYAVQSMGRSMDCTWEGNMVDGLFFCAILIQPHTCPCNTCIISSFVISWQFRRIDHNGSHKPVFILSPKYLYI